MSDKLSVSIWGASLNADGLWAIAAAVIIVGVLALVVVRYNHPVGRAPIREQEKLPR